VLFPGVKRPVRETDNSTQSHVTVKNELSYISTPPRPRVTYMGYCSLYVASVSFFNIAVVKQDTPCTARLRSDEVKVSQTQSF